MADHVKKLQENITNKIMPWTAEVGQLKGKSMESGLPGFSYVCSIELVLKLLIKAFVTWCC